MKLLQLTLPRETELNRLFVEESVVYLIGVYCYLKQTGGHPSTFEAYLLFYLSMNARQLAPKTISPRRFAPSLWTIRPQFLDNSPPVSGQFALKKADKGTTKVILDTAQLTTII